MSLSTSILNSDDPEWINGRLVAELQRLNARIAELEQQVPTLSRNFLDYPNKPQARRNIGIPDGATDTPYLVWGANGWTADDIEMVDSLGGLSDVTLTSPTNGQVLTYNGTIWLNDDIPATDWPDITNKPTTFPPSAHTHTLSGDVTGVVTGTVTIADGAVTSPKLGDKALKPLGEVWGKNVAGEWTVQIPGDMVRADDTLYPTALSFECDAAGGLDISILRNTRTDAPGAKNIDDIEVLYTIRDGGVTTDKLADGSVVDAKVSDVAWSKITGKPTEFPPESHTHTLSGDVTGTVTGPVTIADNAVTNVKIGDVSFGKLTAEGETIADDQFLQWDATAGKFVAATINISLALNDLTDVDTAAKAQDTALYWDAVTSAWLAAPAILRKSGVWNVTGGSVNVFDESLILYGGTPSAKAALPTGEGIAIAYSATEAVAWRKSASTIDIADGTIGGALASVVSYHYSATEANRKFDFKTRLDLQGTSPTEGQAIVADAAGKLVWGNGLPDGTAIHNYLKWDGTEWVQVGTIELKVCVAGVEKTYRVPGEDIT